MADQLAEKGHAFGRLVRENLRLVLAAVAACIFIWLLEEVGEGELTKLDTGAYLLFVQTLRQPWLTPYMESISELAQPVALLAMLLAVEAFAPGRRPGACAAVNLVCAVALNVLLKQLVQRPRPDGFRLIAETGYSFPSGHSMVAMAFYGLLAWMVWHYERDRFVRWLCVIGFGLVIALIGISRIYLGVHYASDVIAGFCVSLIWLALYTKLVVPLMLDEKDAAIR
ncbi:PAP2 family protein [Olsenella sp. AM30-3LB]|jgi:membrane-associated phospholipid phosphatase|uniref:Phosphatase PAP2 family protein n=1 Tax=Tractidigestivibacter montrealensis TaxID=2972466 RepID=A0ABT1Z6N2_9ACTN|nr:MULTISPECIES: phosphatase PAP2 family protein [Atopobiaceae]MCR9035864.1 phosphatase PAP2 family protein [Tractidigestivibacter montrealensis]RHD71942.1 PAP2 family protein [Olsenella sp. AM30-3LB]RHK01576.1 PAP2 family protein [Olsenella sp. AM04-33]